MRIDFHGRLSDEARIRAGFIGCGSHSFRNLYPALQFAAVDLVATCDLDRERAKAFADAFGARTAYDDYATMISREELDAVFICTGYDPSGRPLHARIGRACVEAGLHVWMEKPPAATTDELIELRRAARSAGRIVMVGFKKMFFPANEKARELMNAPGFGTPHLVTIRYPQFVPTPQELRSYRDDSVANATVGFLDHLCHPVSLLLFLVGMPVSLHYARSGAGGGVATFCYESGAVATIVLDHGASRNGGMERTTIVADAGAHITVENNTTVTMHRGGARGYGNVGSFYDGEPHEASAVWQPEFSLGQLYNKGLFLLGYYGELEEFAQAVLGGRPPSKATLDDAVDATRIFEAFAEGPNRRIDLTRPDGGVI